MFLDKDSGKRWLFYVMFMTGARAIRRIRERKLEIENWWIEKQEIIMLGRIKILIMAGLILVSDTIWAAENGAHHAQSADYTSLLFVFMLSTFIGLGVITRVSRLLHTPLMSITNAISAIAVVGSLILTGNDYPGYITWLGAVALFASMTNIVSGFLITDRMLKMFKTKETKVS